MTAVEVDRLPGIARALRAAAGRHGTPLYATDLPTLEASAAAICDAFPDPWLRHYSLKANDVPGIVRLVAGLGFGANVVSRGEWAAARAAGIPNSVTTLEGVGKTEADLREAVRAARDGRPLRWVAVESPDEARALARLAAAADRRSAPTHGGRPPIDVLLRLNPDVAPETHPGLAVGAGGSKFGMTEAEISEAIEALAAAGGALRPRGVHLHVGSQLGAIDAWRDSVRRALALVALLRGSIDDFDTLDVGGGFPVAPLGEPAPAPGRFAGLVPDLMAAIPGDRRPRRLAIEPGRYLVARAGWLVARVLHARQRVGRRQVVIDAGLTELIRPALYGARHGIAALTSLGRPLDGGLVDPSPTLVAGPICESTDELGEHVLPPLRRGDLVAIRDAGAYAASQSSTYNGRPRPAQVVVRADGGLELARRRGSIASLG